MKKLLTTILVFLGLLTVGASIGANAASETLTTSKGKTYKLVTTQEAFVDGNYLISYAGTNFMAGVTSGYFSQVDLNSAIVWKIATTENGKTIQNPDTGNYVGNNGTKNKANEYTLTDSTAHVYWDVTFETDGTAKFTNKTETSTYKFLQYNTGSPRFACYTGGQKNLNIYLEEASNPDATKYKITFDSQNGSAVSTIEIEENKNIPQPDEPVKDGFIFTGWYDSAEGGNLVSFDSLTATANVTYYAHWETDPYSYALISTSAFTAEGSGYAPHNTSHDAKDTSGTKVEFTFSTKQVMPSGELLQFQSNAGCLYNSSSVKGSIHSIILSDLSGNPDVYSSSTMISDVATATKLTGVNGVYTVPEGSNHGFFYIYGGSSTMKASSIKVQYTYVEPTTYSVTFNANGGIFKDAVGETITKNIGETCTGTLPLATDLSQTAYKYTILRGWSDGTKEYLPGASYEVTDNTAFTAVYDVPEYITLAQACEICDITGTTKTPIKFTSKGLITEISGSNVVIKDSSTSQVVTIYGGDKTGIAVGDYIEVCGKLQKYNDIYEFVDPQKFTVLFAGSKFLAAETKSSLKVTYDYDLNPTNVDLRLGGVVDSSVVVAGATFGVFVTDQSFTFESGMSYSSVEEFLAANQANNVKNVECTPAVVTGGHQFAWVITDMEGHYDTNLTAVMYMVYDGVLYICSSKTTSVKATAAEYLNDASITLTDDQKAVLNKLTA